VRSEIGRGSCFSAWLPPVRLLASAHHQRQAA
jgi:hypothetical protein